VNISIYCYYGLLAYSINQSKQASKQASNVQLSDMPHLFVNRQRVSQLLADPSNIKKHRNWEAINEWCYLLGGILFCVGSVFFFPDLDSDVGSWIYFAGSILYLIVNLHDLAEVLVNRKLHPENKKASFWELLATCVYLSGTILFIIGSILFLSSIDEIKPGAYCFIFGSVAFWIGAAVNVLQMVSAGSFLQMQLTNMTAHCFIMGSLLFLVASVPYLWDEGFNLLYRFLAWQYLVGSVLFVVGGAGDYGRGKVFAKRLIDEVERGIASDGNEDAAVEVQDEEVKETKEN